MLFTLWGDYFQLRGGEVWVGTLIRIAAQFGLSELAIRSVLGRMARAGWLEATRHGNRSYYRLARRGQALIAEGAARIFRAPPQPWDGQWHLITYSIPEAQRDQRDQLRKRLSYLGFGALAAGAWITPHDLRTQVAELAADLGVEAYVEQFRGAYLAPGDPRALAARLWPLAELAAAYRAFIQRWHGLQVELERGEAAIPDGQAFVSRFWLIHEYQRFCLEDPDLPPELVPPDWPGRAAAAIFEHLHARLAPGALRFFDDVYESRASSRSSARARQVSASVR
jgi:phenylacetic acid degradation operon negative regulatory protein